MDNKNKKIRKYSVNRITVGDVFLLIILVNLAAVAIFPFYQVILLSFADTVSYASHPLYLLPYVFDLTGYKTIFHDKGFFSSVGVSLFITVVGTFINMFLSVTGAYVLSRKQLVGRRIFLGMIVFTMLFSGGMIPTYLVVKGLGLVNTVWAMILPSAISTYYLIIMKNYFSSLPDSLMEAARLDGANEAVILVRSSCLYPCHLWRHFFCFMRWKGGMNGIWPTCMSARHRCIRCRSILGMC